MSDDRQLTLDGREVGIHATPSFRTPPPTPVQREILNVLRRHGVIRPIDAGMILYEHKGQPWRAKYASADGYEVLRRMAIRGWVHREKPGRWVPGPPEEPVELRTSEKRRRRRGDP